MIDIKFNGRLWNILKTYETNNLKKNKIKKLIFFSSSEVYGNPDKKNIPTKESYDGNVSFTGPRACYDESKRFGETLVFNYSNIYKFNSVIIRPFNNYGPGMSLNDKRIIPDLMKNVLDNKDMILFSDGGIDLFTLPVRRSGPKLDVSTCPESSCSQQ